MGNCTQRVAMALHGLVTWWWSIFFYSRSGDVVVALHGSGDVVVALHGSGDVVVALVTWWSLW